MMSRGSSFEWIAGKQRPLKRKTIELQMQAEMLRAIGDILSKYAARLPEQK